MRWPDDLPPLTALRAFHERYDRDGKDRLDPWLHDAVVAHLVLVRDLR